MYCWKASRFCFSAALVGGIVSLSATGAARQSPIQDVPTFKIAVEQIEVTASVRDRSGQFVRGLTKEDFEVIEDGKRQEVNAVAIVDIPNTLGRTGLFNWRRDTASNDWLSRSRAYLLVLDAALTRTQNTPVLRRAARQFVEQYVSGDDLVAVMVTDGTQRSVPLFTQDRDHVLRAIDAVHGRKIQENGMANEVAMTQILENLERQKNGGQPPDPKPGATSTSRPKSSGDPYEETERRSNPWLDPTALSRDAEEAYLARMAADTLLQGARLMALVPMRGRAIVYISEGDTYNVDDVSGQEAKYGDTVKRAWDAAIGMATRANVKIYAVDPRGVAAPQPTRVEMDATQRRIGNPLTRSHESLRRIGYETGGFAAMSNNFQETFARITGDQSQYYVIGYGGGGSLKQDGRVHHVEVRVRRPDVRVTSRSTYTAPSAREARADAEWVSTARDRFRIESPSGRSDIAALLAELLARPVPTPGFGLRFQPVTLKGWRTMPSGALLAIEIQEDNLDTRKVGDRLKTTIEVGVAAIDESGYVRHRQIAAVDLSLVPERAGVAGAVGARWVSRLPLPPGRYQLRVAAVEQAGGKNGSAYTDVVIPDFERAPNGLSSVIVTSKAAALPTSGWKEVNRWHLPQPMTATRVFTTADVLTATTELYESANPARDGEVVARVLAEDGQELTAMARTFSRQELTDGRYVSRVTLPLDGMASGRYVLRVEGRSGKDKPPDSRVVPFEVVASR